MSELIWKLIAKVVSFPPVANWLISYAERTPYLHLHNEDRTPYMNRYWLFNPISKDAVPKRRWQWCSYSIRVHWIRSADHGAYMHDHPWSARTIILKGCYTEIRMDHLGYQLRKVGDTAKIKVGEFHKIAAIAHYEPTYTLFIIKGDPQPWGFLVNGKKINWRDMKGKK